MQQPQPDTHALPKHPPVSVMVPVYNVERRLPQCIESILAQDYDSLDVVLLDDGSMDGCPAPCGLYSSQDPRVRTAHVANGLQPANIIHLQNAWSHPSHVLPQR